MSELRARRSPSRRALRCAARDDARALAFGMEEEFFIVRIDNGALAHELPVALLDRWRVRFGDLVDVELLQAQVEVRTPVCHTTAQARRSLAGLRKGLNEEATAFGLAVAAAGTHPGGDWRPLSPDESPRHRELLDTYGVVARRNAVCGLHVHVAIPPGIDRVRVMNRVVPWTPLVLALSASSPFWRGERTGLASYRQSAYDEWPRSGTPPLLAAERDYDRLVARMIGSGCISDARSVWWTIRPASRYPTLELRIADACTELDDALCIAALFRCLVRAALADGDDSFERVFVEENRWRAKRDGVDAVLLPPHGGTAMPMIECAEDLVQRLRPHAVALDCEPELAHVHAICAAGGGARRQLAVFDEAQLAGAGVRESLRRVIDDLVARTESSAVGGMRASRD